MKTRSISTKVTILLLIAALLAGCADGGTVPVGQPPAESQQEIVERDEEPADDVTYRFEDGTPLTMVTASQAIPEMPDIPDQYEPLPQPRGYVEDGEVRIWHVRDYSQSGNYVMLGLGSAAIDGPFPFGEVVCIIFLAGALYLLVRTAVAPAPDVAFPDWRIPDNWDTSHAKVARYALYALAAKLGYDAVSHCQMNDGSKDGRGVRVRLVWKLKTPLVDDLGERTLKYLGWIFNKSDPTFSTVYPKSGPDLEHFTVRLPKNDPLCQESWSFFLTYLARLFGTLPPGGATP